METTGWTLCGQVEKIDQPGSDIVGIQECTSDSSDDRLDGTLTLTFTYAEDGAWQGTVEMVNEGGSWSGTFSGTESNGVNTSHTEMVGGGGYEGLIYTGTSKGAPGPGGSGFSEGSGIISVSD